MSLASVQRRGGLSALGESLCCIVALCPLDLLACIHAVWLSLQVKGRQWISGRSLCKAGRVQTFPLICLPLGRIALPQKPLDV